MTAFNADDFWMKGRLFVNRAMEPDDVRSEDERRLWAALALEVLAKWALAETSPTLVADPARGDGEQLFKALGVKAGGPYVSVTASTAFKRCAAIYHPFNEKAASGFSTARNEYLHGAEIALLALPSDVWWSRFWSLVNVLLTAHEREPSDLVGSARVPEVEVHLARNAQRIKEQLEAAVQAAKRNLARFDAGLMTAVEARRWSSNSNRMAMLEYRAEAECPACGAIGTVETDYADSTAPIWPDDPEDTPTTEVTFTPDYFSCPRCHLVLDSYELIVEASLDDQYTIETDEPMYDDAEYGND